jgi:hypothetical protein
MLILNHDDEFDILSISFDNNGSSYVDESYDGIEVFHDMETDQITGLLIYDFLKRYTNKSLFKVRFPVEIDLNSIMRDLSAN